MQHNPDKDHSIEWATKLGAKVFTGTFAPAMAEAWMDKIEKCFDVMGCPDDKRLRLATFLLEEGANNWWRLIQTRYADPSVITWVDFKCAFYDTYYPRSLREEIKTSVTSVEWTEFGKLVKVALRVEKSISERHIQRDQMKFRCSVGQTRTWTSRGTSSQKDRHGFWLGVANTSSFKTKSKRGQSSRSSHGSV
ncbi:Gag protease polyprotein-like protein [Abeliophyllum distichum]|uniref:Gag protease polyprotein-like protein n=1 Tax=Abeliophyllum distichum TaxID=126358 RepID=A0ABD1SZ52_9LAMI